MAWGSLSFGRHEQARCRLFGLCQPDLPAIERHHAAAHRDEQRKLGFAVKKSQLKVGDLLFFKTGWSSRHVGIYIGNNEFMHASTSQGVMISSLDNSYWKQKYWQARRLL